MKVTLACVLLLLPLQASPQEPNKPTEEKSTAESKSKAETAKQVNPVLPTPSSIASGKKSYSYDCAMCHGKEGAGDGDLAGDMHLKLRDYRDPAALKELTDGEIFDHCKWQGQDDGRRGSDETRADLGYGELPPFPSKKISCRKTQSDTR
jgi:hypothetical protein